MRRHSIYCAQNGLGRLIGPCLQTKKNSDTLFILGSGTNINNITEKQWEFIRSKDSLAFNNFPVHPHVPTFYLYQSDIIINEILDMRSDYSDVTFLIRSTPESHHGTILDYPLPDSINNSINKFLVSEFAIPTKCRMSPLELISFFEAAGMLLHGSLATMLPKLRISVSLCLSWAYQMGYKQIILCGCDLINGNHFWDSIEYANSNVWSIPGSREALKSFDPKITLGLTKRISSTVYEELQIPF